MKISNFENVYLRKNREKCSFQNSIFSFWSPQLKLSLVESLVLVPRTELPSFKHPSQKLLKSLHLKEFAFKVYFWGIAINVCVSNVTVCIFEISKKVPGS